MKVSLVKMLYQLNVVEPLFVRLKDVIVLMTRPKGRNISPLSVVIFELNCQEGGCWFVVLGVLASPCLTEFKESVGECVVCGICRFAHWNSAATA